MRYYFAPMEGVTGYIYRNAHREFFGGIDKYYTPFIATNQNISFKTREINDILPEHNQGITVVPQVLGNNVRDFIETVKEIQKFGYEEINLNLGCPSKTVVTKYKGSGFLAVPERLDQFLEEVFANISCELSIKTRIGKDDPEEFEEILEIYNKYPIKELTIHPRVQADYYKNSPNLEVFESALRNSKNPVCYNGDLVTKEDCEAFENKYQDLGAIMLGRGLIRNPNLALDIKEGKKLDKNVLQQFHDKLCVDYKKVLSGDRDLLFKMKEVWFYMSSVMNNYDKYEKKIKKAERFVDYDLAVKEMFRNEDVIQ